MKVFFDTEFTGLQQDTDLLSIGMVAEDGREFYAELNDYRPELINDWLKENVLANFDGSNVVNHIELADQVNKFLMPYGKVEMWADYISWDWIMFVSIFGTSWDLPKNVYYIPFDIQTIFKLKGIDPDISREKFVGMDGSKHNALYDAKVARACYEKLMATPTN